MKKLMMLGAGDGQIPFMKIAKNLGAEVVAVSPKGDYPGFDYADKCYYVDTRDKNRILKIARNERIDAITTDQTDVSVPTVAYVAETIGLPGIGYNTALKFTDKYIMRRAAREIGIPVPNYFKTDNIFEAKKILRNWDYPVVVKPINSSGSRGVYKVCSECQLEDVFNISAHFSTSGEVLVEEFIDGKEYIVDGFALDNEYINLDIGVKEYFDIPDKYISKMCMFSSKELACSQIEGELLDVNYKLVKGFGLPFGLTHGEYIYSKKEQKVYLVEIAARGGGVHLSSELTPEATGVNTNEILLDYLINGRIVDVTKIPIKSRVAAWRCFELVPGIIRSIIGVDKLKKINGVIGVYLDALKIGERIGVLSDDTKKHGPILVSGDSEKECYDSIESIKKVLKIHTVDELGKEWGIKW